MKNIGKNIFKNLWNTVKRSSAFVMGVPEEKKKDGTKRIFEKINNNFEN